MLTSHLNCLPHQTFSQTALSYSLGNRDKAKETKDLEDISAKPIE
jgi:hypothetical protein